MSKIVDPDDSFAFEKLALTKPVSVSGGNYFIRFVNQGAPLYIQSPKCKTRQGIVKGGKKFYTDLIFTSENDAFIRWVENLETYCHQYIFKNREQWFDGDLEIHDIENYFTSPLKLYKAGKCYLLRANVASALGKVTLNIYDEDENKIDPESIGENHELMTILEVQGIKCSARSFQIDIEIRQMMVLKTENLFEKCIIRKGISKFDSLGDSHQKTSAETNSLEEEEPDLEPVIETDVNLGILTASNSEEFIDSERVLPQESDVPITLTKTESIIPPENEDMKEINIILDEIPLQEGIQIKERNDVYYEMYKEAKRKAKIARDLALSSYLEAKRIKNTYLLEDLDDSDSEFSENPPI
jgi:hypothetical protein